MAIHNTHKFTLLTTTTTLSAVDDVSAAIDVDSWVEALVLINVATFDTITSLTFDVETSDDGSTWYKLGSSITAITSIGAKPAAQVTNFGKKIRLRVSAVSGTGSMTATVLLVVKN